MRKREWLANFHGSRMPYFGKQNAASVQINRDGSWILFWFCLASVNAIFWLIKDVLLSRHLYGWSVAAALLGCATVRFAWMWMLYLIDTWGVFCCLKHANLVRELQSEDRTYYHREVGLVQFIFCQDLVQLENDLCGELRMRIKAAKEVHRKAKISLDQANLDAAHSELDRLLLEAGRKVGAESKVRKALRRKLSLSQKRSLCSNLLGFAISKGNDVEPNRESRSERLVEYLVEIASQGLCEQAKALHNLAKHESDRKFQAHLLQEAIDAQKQANKDRAELSPKVLEQLMDEPHGEDISEAVEPLPLWERARRMFVIDDLLPPKVDAPMATTILLVLIAPGYRTCYFQESYRRGTLFLKEVQNQYKSLGMQFERRAYTRTLKWLIGERIVMTQKLEGAYSLVAKPALGRTPNSQEIIRRVVGTTAAFQNDKVPVGVDV